MTNYEKQNNISIQRMSKENICILINQEWKYTGFITSDASFFKNKEDAIQYEINWLQQERK